MIRTILERSLLVVLVLLASAALFLNSYQPPKTSFDVGLTKMLDEDVSSFRTYLLTNGSAVAVTDPWDKSTLLHAACMSLRNAEVVESLLDADADPNALDDLGRTPMHNLCLSRPDGGEAALQIARLLLEHGADLSVKDVYGKVPFDYAGGRPWGDLTTTNDAPLNADGKGSGTGNDGGGVRNEIERP